MNTQLSDPIQEYKRKYKLSTSTQNTNLYKVENALGGDIYLDFKLLCIHVILSVNIADKEKKNVGRQPTAPLLCSRM
jgi:hypothetical protein